MAPAIAWCVLGADWLPQSQMGAIWKCLPQIFVHISWTRYWFDWAESFCESRFWPWPSYTPNFSFYKVEGCQIYWVVRLACKWCDWAATLFTLSLCVCVVRLHQNTTLPLHPGFFLCAPFLSKTENGHLFLELTPTLWQMPRDITNISEDWTDICQCQEFWCHFSSFLFL